MPYNKYNDYDSSDDEREYDESEWDSEELELYLEYNDTDPVYDYMEEEWQEYLNSSVYLATEHLESFGIPTFIIDEILELAELQFRY